MALLGQMQSLLAALYDAPVAHDVHDYLITDPAHAAALQELPSAPGTDEQLLIATTDDGMELGLYLDASVLERLGRRCPLVALDESNLGDYCTALEGVSHFHYVTWSADCDRRVSLLELELQAEVDKYASALSLLLAQRGVQVDLELSGDRAAFYRVYQHAGRHQLALVLLNKGDAPQAFEIDRMLQAGRWRSAFEGHVVEVATGATLRSDVPAEVQERAWTSPIWYSPSGT